MTTRVILPPESLLRERFPITLPGGRTLRGHVYTTARYGGRRIVVLDGREVVFDSRDQFDLSNARSELELWLSAALEG